MSEQSTNGPTVSNSPNITSGVKEKNPRRVAAGKRLGAISRQAKEAKRLEREKTSKTKCSSASTRGDWQRIHPIFRWWTKPNE